MPALPLSWDVWGSLDAVALAELVRSGQVSVLELAGQAAAAIARVDHELCCVLEVFEDIVENPGLSEASHEGLLYGVPILLKDLNARLKGRRQENGSALYRGAVSTETDPFISNILSSGLVPVGRSTTAELGLGWDTATIHAGALLVSRNPFDMRRTPGGSSGGSAAIVAAGAVPVATSSDGGGSTRIPASHCGLIGLKPTRGLCPRPPGGSEYQSRISTDGVLTRSVRDSAAVLDYTARVAPGGSFMEVSSDAGAYLSGLRRPPARLKIGWSCGMWGRSVALPVETVRRLEAVRSLLAEMGHDLIPINDDDIVPWADLWEGYTINWMSARSQLELVAARRGLSRDELQGLLTPMVGRMVDASARYGLADLWRMMALNDRVTRSYGALFTRIDVLLTPAYAVQVPMANGSSSTMATGNVDAWFDAQLDAARYAIPCNEVGAPALAFPTGLGNDGMPIGMQLCGRWRHEGQLLQLAHAIENTKPEWFGVRPAIHVSTVTDRPNASVHRMRIQNGSSENV